MPPTEDAILTFLRANPGISAGDIAKGMTKGGEKATRSELNPILYKMATLGRCSHNGGQPPLWTAAAPAAGPATSTATVPPGGTCPTCGCSGACGSKAKDGAAKQAAIKQATAEGKTASEGDPEK